MAGSPILPLSERILLAGSDLETQYLTALWQTGERSFCQQCYGPYRRGTIRNRRSRCKADFAWHAERVAVEVQGGTWINGRHSRGAGIKRDFRKANDAQLDGWVVLKFDTDMIADGEALQVTQEALETRR